MTNIFSYIIDLFYKRNKKEHSDSLISFEGYGNNFYSYNPSDTSSFMGGFLFREGSPIEFILERSSDNYDVAKTLSNYSRLIVKPLLRLEGHLDKTYPNLTLFVTDAKIIEPGNVDKEVLVDLIQNYSWN